jgi:acyl-CoA thioester hydrolase
MEIRPYLRKVQFYETDAMGIVHHANYIHWMEEARVDYMEQMGYTYEMTTSSGIDLAVTGVDCRYKSMARFGDTVSIQMWITKLSPARVTVAYRITDAADGREIATAESSHFFFDHNKNKPVALPRALPELYQLMSSLCQEADGK